MGPYCNFCGNRCFCHFPSKTPEYILKAYGSSSIIATCKGGQEFEKNKIGYCYDDIIKAIEEAEQSTDTTTQDKKLPAEVDIIAAGYEWICPNCSLSNKMIGYVQHVVCENCRHEFNAALPEHAFGD